MPSDGLKKFDFQAISEINNGALLSELNRSLHQAYLDCEDRPALGTARKVVLEIIMKPEMDDALSANGVRLGRVYTDFVVKKTFPAKGLTVAMKPGSDGLEFRPEIADNPDQQALNFDPEE